MTDCTTTKLRNFSRARLIKRKVPETPEPRRQTPPTNTMNTANPRFVEFVLLIVAIIWGFNPVIIKIGMQHLPPETYNLARMIVASVISLVALVLSGSWRRPSRRQFWAMLRITAVGFCLFQICLIAGLQRTTAGNTSFLLCLVPVSVVLLNRFYGLESLSRAMTVGIADQDIVLAHIGPVRTRIRRREVTQLILFDGVFRGLIQRRSRVANFELREISNELLFFISFDAARC